MPNDLPAGPEELFLLLMENVRDYAIFTVDKGGHVTTWNTGAERILGYKEAEILGQPCDIIFTPEDRAQNAPLKERATARETGRAEDERWHLRKDGTRFWGSGIMTALRDEQGELRGYVKILRDYTERKRHQEHIETLNQRLRRAMAETHHRIKNNLQVVAALVDLQRQTDRETIPLAELERIGQHIRAMASIHELLTEEVKHDPEAGFVSASEILDKLLPLLQKMAGKRAILPAIEEVRLPMRLGSSLAILVNELVSNAIKHGFGEIELSFAVKQQRAQLSVSDSGAGFPEDFTIRHSTSTGLELVESVSRWDLQGEVRYENRPAGGANVIVIFPLPISSSPETGITVDQA